MTLAAGSDAAPDLVLTSPECLVASVPYLLGFTPEESAVVIWLAHGRICLTERIDLPPSTADPVHWRHLSAWLDALLAPLPHLDPDEAIVVMVSNRGDLDGLVEAFDEVIGEHDVSLRDALRVDGDRWWSYLCENDSCCPDEGRALDESTRLRMAAHFAYEGNSPVLSRADLEREIERDHSLAARVRHARGDLPAWVSRRPKGDSWRDEAIVAILSSPVDDPARLAQIAVAEACMDDLRVRDTVLWEAAGYGPPEVRDLADVMRAATAAARPAKRAATATAAAILAWLDGDGARAVTAIEAARRADRTHSLAEMIDCALRGGIPPQMWRQCMADLDRATVRRAAA